MNRNIRTIVISTIFSVLCSLSCTSTQVTGKGSDAGESTAEVTIRGTILSDVNLLVDTIALTISSEIAGDRTQTNSFRKRFVFALDEAGRFELSPIVMPMGNYLLSMQNSAGNAIAIASNRLFLLDSSKVTVTLQDTLKPGLSINGTISGIPSSTQSPYATLRGTSLADTITGTGTNFTLTPVPRGLQVLTVYNDVVPLRHLIIDMPDKDTTFSIRLDTGAEFVLDDFEKTGVNRPFAAWTRRANWITWVNGAGVSSIAPTIPDSGHVTDGLSTVLHIIGKADTGFHNNVSFGLDLTSDRSGKNTFANLSPMQSLQFRAKGSGKITVRFFSVPFRAQFGAVRDLEKEITLTPQWQTFVLNTDDSWIPDVAPFNTANLHWKQLAAQMEMLAFTIYDSTEIWIDDIGINGADPFAF